jgi:hypothetical protein
LVGRQDSSFFPSGQGGVIPPGSEKKQTFLFCLQSCIY